MLAGELPGVQIGAGQQCVVVEHLLEVRHQPAFVDRVAGEAAAEVVVDPTCGHRIERRDRGAQRGVGAGAVVLSQQVVQRHRLRELGCCPEATPARIVGGQHRHRGLVEHRGVGECAGALRCGRAADRVEQPRGLLEQLVTLVAPRVLDRREHLQEAGVPGRRLLGEVGAAEERFAVGGEEHRHRPAALAGHRLGGFHVDRVDVGTLLAVDLDRHEVLVQVRRGGGVLEGLVRHDVAPVARRVADRQQHRSVLTPCQVERLVPPREPVDRVLGVLAQVRAGLGREAVGHAGQSVPIAPRAGPTPVRRRSDGGQVMCGWRRRTH